MLIVLSGLCIFYSIPITRLFNLNYLTLMSWDKRLLELISMDWEILSTCNQEIFIECLCANHVPVVGQSSE